MRPTRVDDALESADRTGLSVATKKPLELRTNKHAMACWAGTGHGSVEALADDEWPALGGGVEEARDGYSASVDLAARSSDDATP